MGSTSYDAMRSKLPPRRRSRKAARIERPTSVCSHVAAAHAVRLREGRRSQVARTTRSERSPPSRPRGEARSACRVAFDAERGRRCWTGAARWVPAPVPTPAPVPRTRLRGRPRVGRGIPKGRDSPGPEPAVRQCEKRFVDTLERRVEPFDRQGPRRVVVDLGDVSASPSSELILEDLQEGGWPSTHRQHPRRCAGRLASDRDDRGTCGVGHEQV